MKSELIKKSIYFPALLMAVLFFVTVSNASDFKTVSSNAGGVRLNVVPLQLAVGQAARFEVRLNTHSVPLDQDLAAVAVLHDNQGHEYKPVQWEGDPPGGHHRKGVLVFPELTAPVASVTLTIREVANVPAREFAWTLNP